MTDDRTRRRALLLAIGGLLWAAVLVGMTANRLYNARSLSGPTGYDAMSRELVDQAFESLSWALAIAVLALLPAAYLGLRRRRDQGSAAAAEVVRAST